METDTVILITVIANLIVQPIIQYMLHSRCSIIRCCCGLIDIKREVPEVNIELEKQDSDNKV